MHQKLEDTTDYLDEMMNRISYVFMLIQILDSINPIKIIQVKFDCQLTIINQF